ncbi:MAG: hypothetical protein IPF66_07515 [Holophagales bacterium]|nr:hypothetical protein [Holophagales bacterium]
MTSRTWSRCSFSKSGKTTSSPLLSRATMALVSRTISIGSSRTQPDASSVARAGVERRASRSAGAESFHCPLPS